MTNKKICLALVVAALVCGIILPACKDEPSFNASDLVGKWRLSGEEEEVFDFKANGEFVWFGYENGTYTTSGSNLTLTIDEGSFLGTFKFDGLDTLNLSGFEGTETEGTYTRIK